jgi:integrase
MASVKRRETTRGPRYDVRYRTPDGQARKETYRTRREADHRANAVETDKDRGSWVDPRRASRRFSDLAAEWLASNTAKRESSRERDRAIIDDHLEPFGKRRIGSITPADVQALVHGLSSSRAPSTVRRSYSTARAIFNYAVASDIIVRSPCRGIKLPSVARPRRRVVTADELAKLADAMGDDYGAMAYLGAVLGLRWGEIAGLRVGRVDFLAGTLTVAEQLTRGAGGRMVESAPKSEAGRRTFAVPKPLLDMLSAHLARRGLTGADSYAYVFIAPGGEPLHYSNWRHRVWEPAIQAAGLEDVSFHDLRRAAATAMVRRGVDLKTAQARLGHSTPTLTLGIYAQATEEADRDAAEELGEHWIRPRHGRAMDDAGGTQAEGL